MADNSSAGERTEAPSAKRRADFRKKGQVTQSKEVQTAALLTISVGFWYFYAPIFWNQLSALLAEMWGGVGQYEITQTSLVLFASFILKQSALLLAPVFLVTLVVGFFSTFAQIGWLFTGQPLVPDLKKLDPIKGMSRFISKRSFVEIIKSLAKVLVIGWVSYKTLLGKFDDALLLSDMVLVETVYYLGNVTALVMLKVCAILIILAAIDYSFVRYEMEEKMKMTKQEQKEEMKESEGDPHVKAKIRSIQQAMARRRMMAAVPEADVVITNPTHYAVAIVYRTQEMDAPMVVAKGTDLIAARIREIARENDVLLVENPPVARLLHSRVEIGNPIPDELFQVVAEILAHVYSIKGKM